MRTHAIAAITLLATSPIHAQQAATTPADEFRDTFVEQCVSGRGARIDADGARRFCRCAFGIVANDMTLQEFMDMDHAGRAGRDVEKLPQYVRVKSRLEACKAKK